MNRSVSAVCSPLGGDAHRPNRPLLTSIALLAIGLAWMTPSSALAGKGQAPNAAGHAPAASQPSKPVRDEPVARGGAKRPSRADHLREKRAPAGQDAAAAGRLPTILPPPTDGFLVLEALFEDRRRAQAEGDVDKVLDCEREIAALRDDLAIDNLFSFSTALLTEARALLDTNPEEARRKAQLASALSPALAQPRWLTLFASWKARQSADIGLGALAGEARAAFQASLREPYGRATRQMDWLLIAPWLALAIAIAALSACLCRSARYLLHDLSHWAPRGVGPVLILPLLLLLAALIWLSGFGLFGPLAFLGLLVIPYASASERAVLCLSVLMLAAMPLLVREAGERQPFLDADAQALYFIDRGGPEGRHLGAHEARLAQVAEHSYAASYVLGRKAVRLGDYARAIPLLRQATRLNQTAPEPWIALGNAYLCTGELDRAFENYTRARQHGPQNAEAAFNLSSYYLRKAQLAPNQEQSKQMLGLSRSMLDEAGTLAPALVRAPFDMRANHFVLTAPLDVQALSKSARQPQLARDLGAGVTRLFFGAHSQGWSLKAALSVLAIWLVYGLGRLLVPVARPCFKCGAPACTRCEQRSPSPGLCAPCFNVFGQQGRLDSTACAQREWQIQRQQRWRARAILTSALLLPCSGALWRGQALRGALGLACSCLLVSLIAFPEGFFPSPFAALPPLLKRVPAIALLAIIWAQSFLATYRALRARMRRHPQPLGKVR